MTEKNYQKSVDIWSLGVILSELMYCSSAYTSQKDFDASNRFLFNGTSCYPISPRADKDSDDLISKNDQILKIYSRFPNLG